MLELARLYLITEDLDACQYQCMVLLKKDTDNDDASMVCLIKNFYLLSNINQTTLIPKFSWLSLSV